MGKYAPLQNYLLGLPDDQTEVTLTFSELERILGRKLSASAHRHEQWWDNESAKHSHVQARAWEAAGWMQDGVSRREKWVRFRKMR